MRFTTTFLFLLCLPCAVANASDGELDPGFGNTGNAGQAAYYNLEDSSGLVSQPVKLLRAKDGSLYLVGVRVTPQFMPRLSLFKADAQGFRDLEFGSNGLVTYPMPCTATRPSDAAIDSQGRIWVAVNGCNDVRVYRFRPDGELDISLLGSGFIAMDFAGGVTVASDKIAITLTPADSILVAAGIDNNGLNAALAVAHFKADGAPFDGFGVAGLSTRAIDKRPTRINAVHWMHDGRFIVDGVYGPPNNNRVFVARFVPSGDEDGSFGNLASGLSAVNIETLLAAPLEAPELLDSVLNPDGSLIQAGYRVRAGTESNRDFMILKWTREGNLDTGIGPHGHRSYPLDFGGPNAVEPATNWDLGSQIIRQGDGKYVLAGKTWTSQGVEAIFLRLKRDLTPDPSFHGDGKVLHAFTVPDFGASGSTEPADLLMTPGRLLLAGQFEGANSDYAQSITAISVDVLFADPFD